MLRHAALSLSMLLVVAGCNSGPEIAARESAKVATADYPSLAPIDELLASSQEESRAKPAETELSARAAGLRARANALRNR